MDIEGIGAFYLGKRWDAASGAPVDEPIMLDARTLTTHAVCVGMTGSGKTGLCVALLEEALLDGVPVLAIDPKGDLANLALTFPNLAADDFAPWIDPLAAQRDGTTAADLAAKTATKWRDGIGQWGQAPERIARLRAAGEVVIYTPGSEAGVPLSVLRSFAPPATTDGDGWRDRLESAVSGLLALVQIEADPLQSREHVLLSTIVDRAWRAGQAVSLAQLVERIVRPDFDRVGAFDLETFYPARDRNQLAMAINTVLASPGFATWLAGTPLDMSELLYTKTGKPRIAVISIAHLSDAERMFVVTALMQEVVSWMRGQPGTGSLRALVFMDEVFGFLPPSAAPPSKKPMLTLLKQARAYGVGMVLATQNPVDLDYKALSNTGTWLLGRLQTERDKARVLDGLEGAAGLSMNRAEMDRTLSGLGQRVFVLHSVHASAPVLMHSRWALSYLAGPLTRAQITRLTQAAGQAIQPIAGSSSAVGAAPPGVSTAAPSSSAAKPIVPSGLTELFIGGGAMQPMLIGAAKVHYTGKGGIDVWREVNVVTPLGSATAGDFWADAALAPANAWDGAATSVPDGATWGQLPSALSAKTAPTLDDQLRAWIYRACPLVVRTVPALKLQSRPDESQADFTARVALAQREARDAAIAKLEAKYAPKLARLEEKARTAEQRVDKEKAEASGSMMASALSIGGGVLGALFGGKKKMSAANVGRAASAARSMGRAAQQRGDVARASDTLETVEANLEELRQELAEETAALGADTTVEFAELELAPKKLDTAVTKLALVWRGS